MSFRTALWGGISFVLIWGCLGNLPVAADKSESGSRNVSPTQVDPGRHVFESGKSEKFVPLPEFTLFSAPNHDPENGIGYPGTEQLEKWELPNSERYPFQIRDASNPSISGLRIVGQQSRELPWRVMKAMWDGDALHVKGCRGRLEVSNAYWENVEDGLGPMEGLDYWSLRDSWLRYIRDDAIENDDLMGGEIVNCLIDGCFTFLSQRAEPPRENRNVTTILDCLIHIEAQPHDGIPGKEWRDKQIHFDNSDGIGRAPGMLFKWEKGAGSVVMKNCLVLIDGVSINGEEDMEFPPGRYENVSIIWRGRGRFPADLPQGVAVTEDIEVWRVAREQWIQRSRERFPEK